MLNKTKIICTIGQQSENQNVLEEMLLSGMNVARLNLANGGVSVQQKYIDSIAAVFGKIFFKRGADKAVLTRYKNPFHKSSVSGELLYRRLLIFLSALNHSVGAKHRKYGAEKTAHVHKHGLKEA